MEFNVHQPRRRPWRPSSVGWRRAGTYLAILISTLLITLVSCLFVSLYGLKESSRSLSLPSVAYRGDCDVSTRINTASHLVINLIASGILASSNYFMQVLCAPTRSDVDKAHSKGKALEIGVQSCTNLFSIPVRKTLFWVLLAISTTPFHLIFNSIVLESRASTDFVMVMASEEFAKGAPFSVENKPRVFEIQRSLSEEPSKWERLTINDCCTRYNDTSRGLSDRRDVVMLLELSQKNTVGAGSFGWQVNGSAESSVWFYREYMRTDQMISRNWEENRGPTTEKFGEDEGKWIDFDDSTFTVRNKAPQFPGSPSMVAMACISEIWKAPCRLEVDNGLLTIVIFMSLLKCILCVVVLLTDKDIPLITPGDAIESFIRKPDENTLGCSSFDCRDFNDKQREGNPSGYRWLAAAQLWKTETPPWPSHGLKHDAAKYQASRRILHAVPFGIGVGSYFLIGCSLMTAIIFYFIASNQQTMQKSSFGHSPMNSQVNSLEVTTLQATLLANTPQLALSMSYLALNGILTRMLAEFEWASFSMGWKTLRVSQKKGCQRSTYRLQLPYRWSLPLLGMSALLHWLYSNSIYLTIYEGYAHPNGEVNSVRGLGFSTKSIFISITLSISVALTSLILGFFFKLPGQMPLAKNSSAVISAACHCIHVPSPPAMSTETLDKPLLGSTSYMIGLSEFKSTRSEEEMLQDMATGKLRWGVVSPNGAGREFTASEPGRLAFGSPAQDVSDPVQGSYYA